MKGIDVSYANGSIDWGSVRKSCVEFAVIRSTFGSDLPSQIDNQFYQNASGCVKNNIPFGTYHFAYFTDADKARDEADFAIKIANEYKEYVKFIALDIEEDSERYANRVGANPNWTECALVFMERVRSAGYVPVLYSNQSWLVNKLDFNKVKGYKLWYAAPGASSPKYTCAIWQYDWQGQVSGIRGDVDMNMCYDDDLIKDTKVYPTIINNDNKTKDDSSAKSTTAKKVSKPDNEISQISSSQPVEYTVKIMSSNGVNIRQGAGTSYNILGAVPFGVNVEVTRATFGGGYMWGLVEYNGVKGWIALDFTQRIGKSIYQLAMEVIVGKWGAGEERERKLTAAGYSYKDVQAKVNELMK